MPDFVDSLSFWNDHLSVFPGLGLEEKAHLIRRFDEVLTETMGAGP